MRKALRAFIRDNRTKAAATAELADTTMEALGELMTAQALDTYLTQRCEGGTGSGALEWCRLPRKLLPRLQRRFAGVVGQGVHAV